MSVRRLSLTILQASGRMWSSPSSLQNCIRGLYGWYTIRQQSCRDKNMLLYYWYVSADNSAMNGKKPMKSHTILSYSYKTNTGINIQGDIAKNHCFVFQTWAKNSHFPLLNHYTGANLIWGCYEVILCYLKSLTCIDMNRLIYLNDVYWPSSRGGRIHIQGCWRFGMDTPVCRRIGNDFLLHY